MPVEDGGGHHGVAKDLALRRDVAVAGGQQTVHWAEAS